MEQLETFSLFRGLSVHKVMELVHLLEHYESDVFFEKKGRAANGKSVLGMMAVFTTIRIGDVVHMRMKGSDSKKASSAVRTFLSQMNSDDEVLSYWEEEGCESVERARTGCMSSWSPGVSSVAKSYLKTTRH
ncbi:HPr family phosphocarrier protein [Alteribacillus sp. HJP-4]|uniref:HPr family phosphocarrier protein n=1 Tax=Alteribacillus sp. HJP-4 TaxID=2775394 RepID=UPI0035CCCB78